jgi:hypothetical protein
MRKAALVSLILAAWPASALAAKPPVLVELFTAQGCKSCDEANAYVGKLAERPGVVALTFSVDYWDYLGWTDTFAKPEFTKRQQTYVTRLQLREPYTPQVVVDGEQEGSGLKTHEIDKVIKATAAARRYAPDMKFIGPRRVDVGSGRAPRGGADVWLIRYEPGPVETAVRGGDNRGAVVQSNVVREIRRLGTWRGRPQDFRVPAASGEGLKTLVVVQTPKGGRVLGVSEVR